MLHLLGFPSNRNDLFELLLTTLNDNDDVVMLDEGLQWVEDKAALARLISEASVSVYQLSEKPLDASLSSITAAQLIALSEKHPACSSWYP